MNRMANNIKTKVSVIVPAYNTEKYVAQTLDSILQQTFTDWECIVLDDGSTDRTAEIVKQYCQRDARIKYYYQSNGGLSSARNTAIHYSSGEFLLPVDSDDIIDQKYLEKAVERFIQYPETTLVYGEVQKFGAEEGIFELPVFSYPNLLFDYNMIVATAMYRRSDYDKVGGYRTNLIGLEDWGFWIALLSPDSIVYKIPEVVLYYRIRENSLISLAHRKARELREIIYWNNAQKYDRYLPNFTYHRYYGHDCEQILNDVPEKTRDKVLFFQRHVFLSSGEYTWKHAIINKITKLLGVGIVYYKKDWQ